MLKTVIANMAAAKVALSAAAAAAATGGIAIAAATGNLPSTAQGPDHANQAAHPAASSVSVAAPEASESDEASSPANESEGASATPSPSLSGLCKAYQAGATDNPGKALQNPAFSVLVAAAGGADQATVTKFCNDRVGPAASHGPGAHPTGAPEAHPNATNHPTGAPTGHPTGAPSSLERP